MKLKIISFTITLFLSTPIFSQESQYVKGYYLDTLNNKTEGYIKILSGSRMKFKHTIKGKKVTLKSDNINGFSINNEKYRIINNFKSKPINVLAFTKCDSGFAKEIILGDINLFTHIITTNNGMYYGQSGYYFIQKGEKNTPIQVYSGRNKFRKQMKQFLADKDEINKKINFKKIKYSDIESIINIYNEL
ncbi:MAG: hypothetical protein QM478_04730 [Flavobacteriaceae bacterium]